VVTNCGGYLTQERNALDLADQPRGYRNGWGRNGPISGMLAQKDELARPFSRSLLPGLHRMRHKTIIRRRAVSRLRSLQLRSESTRRPPTPATTRAKSRSRCVWAASGFVAEWGALISTARQHVPAAQPRKTGGLHAKGKGPTFSRTVRLADLTIRYDWKSCPSPF